MPAVDDWMNKPLEVISCIFEKHGLSACHEKVKEYFADKIKLIAVRNKIPSLNDTALHSLECNTLVRFRCMIQDMFDPEFFMGAYETIEQNSQRRKLCCGLYKDITEHKNVHEIDYESPRNITLDRQTFYCISLPGENIWVKKKYSEEFHKSNFTSSGSFSRTKRSHEDDEGKLSSNCDMMEPVSDVDDTYDQNKRSRSAIMEENESHSDNTCNSTASLNLNFPIPNMEGKACIVKIYESNEDLKLNDTVEFIGILSADPLLTNTVLHENTEMAVSSSDVEMMAEEELAAHNPPASLVPRLHAILTYPCDHNNPHLPQNLKSSECQSVLKKLALQAPNVREELMTVLTHVLLGDTLSAEFLLCHLISSVYIHRDVFALGKFCLNIINVPTFPQYPNKFYKLIEQLTTKSFYLPLSLQNLNTWKFIPKKDYKANRLTSGILQLSQHTHLFVDETALSVGLLESHGVKNLTALGSMIRWQKVEYDFDFHKLEYTANIPTLVLSEGKSLLPNDCQIPLPSGLTEDDLTSNFQMIERYLTDHSLQKFQCYLTWLKLSDYSLSEELQTAIQQDFVEMRKQDETFSQDDLHFLLILARLLSLSFGESCLSMRCWERAKLLEKERKILMKQRERERDNENLLTSRTSLINGNSA